VNEQRFCRFAPSLFSLRRWRPGQIHSSIQGALDQCIRASLIYFADDADMPVPLKVMQPKHSLETSSLVSPGVLNSVKCILVEDATPVPMGAAEMAAQFKESSSTNSDTGLWSGWRWPPS
jgi:hypothetical protein